MTIGKSFVQEELVDINMQLETATEGEYKEDLKNQKQVLEWRLEKKIFHMAVII